METLTEREKAAMELLVAERAFQAAHQGLSGTAATGAYAAARARLESAQLRAEALLAHDCYTTPMRYEDFRATWEHALRNSRLSRHGFREERLDTGSLDRTYLVRVEPPRGQDALPFHVVAELSWRWTALHSARSATSEEDAVMELLGTRTTPKTARPWLRVDLKLSATLMHGQAIAMPMPKAWAAWAREALGRLENIEPLLPEGRVREHHGRLPEVLAWRAEPTLEVQCSPSGELRLAGVSLGAGVALDLPRQWSDSEKHDEEPDEALAALFARLEGALHAWSESLDHLRPTPSPGS